MASFYTSGIDELGLSMEELARTPETVMDQMLEAGADVIAKAQKDTGRRMGVHRTGVTLESIKKTKPKGIGTERYIEVKPIGKNKDGNANAEVAFINEYGKRGQPARPFMRTANKEKENEAVEAAEKVYHEYIDSKGL